MEVIWVLIAILIYFMSDIFLTIIYWFIELILLLLTIIRLIIGLFFVLLSTYFFIMGVVSIFKTDTTILDVIFMFFMAYISLGGIAAIYPNEYIENNDKGETSLYIWLKILIKLIEKEEKKDDVDKF